MNKNRAVKNGIWLAVMIASLLLLVLCSMYAMQGGHFDGIIPANETPHEVFILTEQFFFF